ncbi:MAG TPA: hypothetical protein VFW96_06690 [Thermomicrobiales bacterium]|nr:hypothetical protein [Thermomicrobiales bacterium]
MPALSGIVIGLGEWALLRRRLARADQWFLATLTAALAGTALVWWAGPHVLFADNPFWPEWYPVTASIIMGAVLSLAQAAVLRREDERHSRRAVEWLVFGSVAYGLGQWSIIAFTWGQAFAPPFLGLSTLAVGSLGWVLRRACIGVLGWTVYGIVTALALARWTDREKVSQIVPEHRRRDRRTPPVHTPDDVPPHSPPVPPRWVALVVLWGRRDGG